MATLALIATVAAADHYIVIAARSDVWSLVNRTMTRAFSEPLGRGTNWNSIPDPVVFVKVADTNIQYFGGSYSAEQLKRGTGTVNRAFLNRLKSSLPSTNVYFGITTDPVGYLSSKGLRAEWKQDP